MSRALSFLVLALAILVAAGGLQRTWFIGAGPLAWGLLSSAALYGLSRRFLKSEGRGLEDAGLRWSPRTPLRWVLGFAIGASAYALTLLSVAALFGPIRLSLDPSVDSGGIGVALAGTAALVVMEELAFRGYAFWAAVRSRGIWQAQLIIALAFCLLHVAYGWSLAAVLLGVLPCAVLFGMAALVSGGLALPIGIHLGMNVSRLLTGESGSAGVWTLDTSALAGTGAASWAPAVGAAIPLVIAALLYLRRGGSAAPRQA